MYGTVVAYNVYLTSSNGGGASGWRKENPFLETSLVGGLAACAAVSMPLSFVTLSPVRCVKARARWVGGRWGGGWWWVRR